MFFSTTELENEHRQNLASRMILFGPCVNREPPGRFHWLPSVLSANGSPAEDAQSTALAELLVKANELKVDHRQIQREAVETIITELESVSATKREIVSRSSSSFQRSNAPAFETINKCIHFCGAAVQLCLDSMY